MEDYYQYSDFEVVEKLLRTHNNKWFAILYDRYASKVYGKSIFLIGNKELAEDITQDVFVKAFINISRFERKSTFYTWIYSITYNVCIDFLRKSKKYINVSLDDVVTSDVEDEIEDEVLMRIEIDRLKILLEEIPTEDKIILLMKYQDDMSINDISQIMKIGKSATKMRINRAKLKIINLYNKKYRHNIY